MAVKTLYEWFAESARQHPEQIALITDDRTVTYSGLRDAAARVAHDLGPARPKVGLLASRSPVDYAAYLGILRAGGTVVPLNAAHPADHNRRVAAAAGLDLIVADRSLDQAAVAELGVPTVLLNRRDLFADAMDPADTEPARRTDPDDVAYILFTSGSTGTPKGVPIRHRNLDAFLRHNIGRYEVVPGCRLSQTFDLTFDPSVFDMFVAWGGGATLVVASRAELLDPVAFVRKRGITHWYSVPSIISMAARAGGLPTGSMPTVRWSLFAGERFSLEQARAWADAAPASLVENLYGPTELTITVTAYRLPAERANWPNSSNGSVPIGRILPHLDHRISDEGELQVRGPQRFSGYLDPADDAGRFARDRAGENEGRPGPDAWYCTGDRVTVEAGELVHQGRLDNQVKIQGRRLEPEEVEAALRAHTSLVEVIVVAVADADGHQYLVAVHAGPLSGLDTFRASVPSHFVPQRFLQVDAIPLNSHGKADRRQCRTWASEAASQKAAPLPTPPPASPQTSDGDAPESAHRDAAAALLQIFRTQLAAPGLGPDDGFYAFGGDSLIAVRVVVEARSQGLPLSLGTLLAHETVNAIVAQLASAAAAENPAGDDQNAEPMADSPFALLYPPERDLVPAGVEDALPASSLQAAMVFLAATGAVPMAYHLADGWEVDAPFDEGCFRTALSGLARRHPALRAAFDVTTFTEPTQLLWRDAEPPLTVDHAADPEQADLLQDDWLGRRAGLPFELGSPRLLRCHVTVLPGSFRIVLAVHHAIADGWSLSRLAVDLMVLYHSALGLDSPDLPEPPATVWHEFVRAERSAAADPQARAHWLNQADAPALLPGRRTDVPNPSGTLAFELDAAQVEGLSATARRLGAPLKSVALAAHVKALAQWTGREHDLVTGLGFHTRPVRPGADLAVGLFVNALPLRVAELPETWAGLVGAVAAAERAGVPHQAFPQARIVQLLGRPAFDVVFNFMNFHALDEIRDLSGLPMRDRWHTGRTTFPLHVNLQLLGSGAEVRIGFDPSLFAAERIGRFAALMQDALRSVVGARSDAADRPELPLTCPSWFPSGAAGDPIVVA
ncbi:AMP-binding protein [Catenulispora subtropica]|uniref:Carrier domain-containing protein n=1 Tax=Catenulispora subtropica TaxID=450798 RepID=A0ABP5DL48_9ACTN